MSQRRGRALVAAAGLAAVVFAVAWRARTRPAPAPRSEEEIAESERVPAARAAPPLSPTPTPTPQAVSPEVRTVLTPAGTARALAAIAENEQTRRLFAKLQTVGLTPEQRDRLVLILGTAARRPGGESPTLEALLADGRSRPLSHDEAKRVLDERQRIAHRRLQDLQPALAAVLTPTQLAQAGLVDDRAVPQAPVH